MEILITLVFLSIALLAVTSQFPVALRVGQSAEDLTVATNLAQELLEEIRTLPWQDPSGVVVLGPDAGETDRVLHYNDVDDYDGLYEHPPRDLDGYDLDGTGGRPNFSQYARMAEVTYADPATLEPTVTVTDIKKVTVTVRNVFSGQEVSLYLFVPWRP